MNIPFPTHTTQQSKPVREQPDFSNTKPFEPFEGQDRSLDPESHELPSSHVTLRIEPVLDAVAAVKKNEPAEPPIIKTPDSVGPKPKVAPASVTCHEKDALFAGLVVHEAALRKAIAALQPTDLDSVFERHYAIILRAAIDLLEEHGHVCLGLLRDTCKQLVAADLDLSPMAAALLTEILDKAHAGPVPTDTETDALLRRFLLVKTPQIERRKAGRFRSTTAAADQLLQLKELESVELFNDGANAYATVPGSASGRPGLATYRVDDASFGTVAHEPLAHYALTGGTVPKKLAMDDAVASYKAIATFDGRTAGVHVRLAEHEGALYVDLVNDDCQYVRVDAEGWTVVDETPVKFIRRDGMKPLPVPERGGSLLELKDLVNLQDDAAYVLAVSWLLGAMHPTGPYPLLVVSGEQGSAKTTTAETLKRLIDPSDSPLRSPPKNAEDLMIAARNGHVVAYDNLSFINADLSDAMCRLTTGAGLSKRKLYTDEDEVVLKACRPVIINGIEELATRADLLDRSITLTLKPIERGARKTAAQLAAELTLRHPRLLGAILDAVAAAMANRATVQVPELPRMADFATWVSAAEPALPWAAGQFMRHYEANRQAATYVALEANSIGSAMLEFAERGWFFAASPWVGSGTELLLRLGETLPIQDGRRVLPKDWPTKPNVLSGQLTRMSPALRASGIDVTFGRIGDRRWIKIVDRNKSGTSVASAGVR